MNLIFAIVSSLVVIMMQDIKKRHLYKQVMGYVKGEIRPTLDKSLTRLENPAKGGRVQVQAGP